MSGLPRKRCDNFLLLSSLLFDLRSRTKGKIRAAIRFRYAEAVRYSHPVVHNPRANSYRSSLIWYSMMAVTAAAYVAFCGYTPITLVAGSNLDDALFIYHAQLLSTGHWLGPFSQFTLMKGPGYSAFLALSAWSGLPISVSEAMFNCLAVGILAWVVWRLSDSAPAAVAIFLVTLWNPGLVSLRVLRQAIYSAQTILILATFSFALFASNKRARIIRWSALAGVLLGWFWLTREEGPWILPGIAILIGGAALRSWIQSRAIRPTAVATASMVLAFGIVMIAFRIANLFAYGSFVGVDTQESNFIGAVDALQSVEVGKLIPYVPVTAKARAQIYEVSPAFASIRPYLDPPDGSPFEVPGCKLYPWTCDEIAGGWFIWALRDAAASAGYYRSPARAAEFFQEVRTEVEFACAEHRLVCHPSPIPFMPRMSREQVWSIPTSFRKVLSNLLFHRPPLLLQGASSGVPKRLDDYWRFLNRPIYIPVAEKLPTENLFLTYSEYDPGQREGAALIRLALRVRRFLNYAYGFIVPAIFWPGLAAMLLAVWMRAPRQATCDPTVIMAAAAWILLFSRILLIALIDASSFPAASWEYAAPAFPLSCIAPILSIASAVKHPLFNSFRIRYPKADDASEDEGVGAIPPGHRRHEDVIEQRRRRSAS